MKKFSLVVFAAIAVVFGVYTQSVTVSAQGSGSSQFPAIAGSGSALISGSGQVTGSSAIQSGPAAAPPAPAAGASAFTIVPTFDTTITNDPNSAAIQAAINRSLAIYSTLFNDPLTVNILFRYSTVDPNGNPLGTGVAARSNFVIYSIPWNTYLNSLRADARSANDAVANASLPVSAMSANINPSSASGRAIGLVTPGNMTAAGAPGGGSFDGIITLNSSLQFAFNRPPGTATDAQRAIEHEVDEVLGLGSSINAFSDLRPQDLFSWSAPGTRNVTATGTRYFSIDGGNTRIVDFNQTAGGDYGDWASGPCPQTFPYVQNAFSCAGQIADVTPTSPEGVNLDVIGYDLITGATTPSNTDFDYDGDGKADVSVFRPSDGVWYLQRSAAGFFAAQFGTAGDVIVPEDYTGDGKTDIAVWRPPSGSWFILRSENSTFYGTNFGFSGDIPVPGDYDGDGRADLVVYRPSQGTWFLQQSTAGFSAIQFGTFGDKPTRGDFDGDQRNDIAVFRPSTGVWYRLNSSNGAFFGAQFGQTGDLVVPADYTGDGKTDLAVFRPSLSTWFIMRSETPNSFYSVQFGISGDLPVPADYDGDAKADIAVWRPASAATFFIQRSTAGFTAVPFGTTGDKPTPNAYVY